MKSQSIRKRVPDTEWLTEDASFNPKHCWQVLQTTDPVDKVATLLGSLAFDSSPEEIQTVADTVKKACPSEEVMDRISKQLLSQCQENWRFSSTAAQVKIVIIVQRNNCLCWNVFLMKRSV